MRLVMTYGQARDRSALPKTTLERNTRLIPREIYADGELQSVHYAIQFHETDVVTIMPGNRYALRTGGWATKATHDRISAYSPVTWRTLWTKIGRGGGYDSDTNTWYEPEDTSDQWRILVRPDVNDPEPQVSHNSPVWREWVSRQWVPFYEGIIIGADGYVLKRIRDDYLKAKRTVERRERAAQRARETRARRQRHLERQKNAYKQRREAREPRFERIAIEIVNDIREVRTVLSANSNQEVNAA